MNSGSENLSNAERTTKWKFYPMFNLHLPYLIYQVVFLSEPLTNDLLQDEQINDLYPNHLSKKNKLKKNRIHNL